MTALQSYCEDPAAARKSSRTYPDFWIVRPRIAHFDLHVDAFPTGYLPPRLASRTAVPAAIRFGCRGKSPRESPINATGDLSRRYGRVGQSRPGSIRSRQSFGSPLVRF